jgi:hypothetical protein
MTTSLVQRSTLLFRRLWRQLMTWRRKSPIERYLDQAVDFKDLEYRMRLVQESQSRRLW